MSGEGKFPAVDRIVGDAALTFRVQADGRDIRAGPLEQLQRNPTSSGHHSEPCARLQRCFS